MNKNTWIVFIIIIIIAIGAYSISKHNKDMTPTDAVSSETSGTGTTSTTGTKTGTATTGSNAAVNVITNNDWKIAFTKAVDWTLTPMTDKNKQILSDVAGDGKGDSIIIQYVTGDKITDTDAKFGSITYYYEKSTGKWMETDNAQTNSANVFTTPAPAKVVTYTADKLPVYAGTTRWLTYIVPLSNNTFLKLNITGSGATQPLQDLIKTVHKI